MVRANLEKQSQLAEPELEDPPQERIHVAIRLGPANEITKGSRDLQKKSASKIKPGRPPGKNKGLISPKVLPGANSRKRKSIQVGTPPRRKLNLDSQPQGSIAVLPPDQASGPRRGQNVEEETTGSHALPNQRQIKLILAARKKSVDFRDPPCPLP